MVVLILGHKADKGKPTIWMVHLCQALNSAKIAEHLAKILICEAIRVILDVQVIGVFSGVLSVLWLVWYGYAVLVRFGFLEHFHGQLGVLRVVIGDKAISARGVVLVH